MAPGDWVSLHWEWVCDRLTEAQVRRLRHYTERHLAIVNDRSTRSLGAPALGSTEARRTFRAESSARGGSGSGQLRSRVQPTRSPTAWRGGPGSRISTSPERAVDQVVGVRAAEPDRAHLGLQRAAETRPAGPDQQPARRRPARRAPTPDR